MTPTRSELLDRASAYAEARKALWAVEDKYYAAQREVLELSREKRLAGEAVQAALVQLHEAIEDAEP